MMADPGTCICCEEDFNRSTRKPLQCPYCNTTKTCRSCMQLSIGISEDLPSCPYCKKYWTTDVLLAMFTKKYINEVINVKRKKKAQDLESSLLPAMQVTVLELKHLQKQKRNLDITREDTINRTKRLLRSYLEVCEMGKRTYIDANILKQYVVPPDYKQFLATNNYCFVSRISTNRPHNRELDDDTRKSIEDLLTLYNNQFQTFKTYNSILNRIAHIKTYYNTNYAFDVNDATLAVFNEKETKGSSVFVRECTQAECNGFISEDHICGICETDYCSKCEEKKEEEHKCKEEDIASVSFKKKHSKPCPNVKCGVPIFKVSGCDQMWCTKCFTTFSWNRGTIIHTKTIHNPHFLQHQRSKKVPVEREDGPCGRPSLQVLKERIKLLFPEYTDDMNLTYYNYHFRKYNVILQFHGILGEIIDGTLPNEYAARVYSQTTLAKERYQVLLSFRNKDELGDIAFNRQMIEEFNLKVRENLFMVCNSGIDMLRNISIAKTASEVKEQYIGIYNLCCLYNQNMRKLFNIYKKRPHYLVWNSRIGHHDVKVKISRLYPRGKKYISYKYPALEFVSTSKTIVSCKRDTGRNLLYEYDDEMKRVIENL